MWNFHRKTICYTKKFSITTRFEYYLNQNLLFECKFMCFSSKVNISSATQIYRSYLYNIWNNLIINQIQHEFCLVFRFYLIFLENKRFITKNKIKLWVNLKWIYLEWNILLNLLNSDLHISRESLELQMFRSKNTFPQF